MLVSRQYKNKEDNLIMDVIGYDLAKIIYENLAMRDNDKLIPNENVDILFNSGALRFVEEVTNGKKLKNFHIDHKSQDENYYYDNIVPE